MNNNEKDLSNLNDDNKKKLENFLINYEYNLGFFQAIQKNNLKLNKLKSANDDLKIKLEKITQKLEDENDESKKGNLLNEINSLNEKITKNNEQINFVEEEIKNFEQENALQNANLSDLSYLEIKNLVKSYGDNKVLQGLNLNVKQGECIAIVGHNGSGKSTLIEIISGTKKGISGEINYKFASSKEDLGRKMSIQFQRLNYPEGYKVKEVVNFFYKMVPKENTYTKEEFKNLLKDFGINTFYKKSLVSLSGGQQQRINLFLTFIKKPSFLILDELSAGLDVNIYDKITELFKNYITKNNVTTIIISHNYREIQFFADNVYLLRDGVLKDPIHSKKLTEPMFFEMIKREKTLVTDFKFDFTKEENKITENKLIVYYKELRNLYIYWLFSKETLNNKINEFIEKDKVLIKELELVSENSNIIEEVLAELIKEKANYSKVKKEFQQHLKKQEKLQAKIEKNEYKIDLYNYLISDEFTITRIKWTKIVLNIQIQILERKYKRADKKLNKLSNKNDAKDVESKKLQKYQTKTKELNEELNSKKELYKSKTIELDFLIQKIEKQKKDMKKNYVDKISIINLKKYFGIKAALNGINLEILKGERIAITGPNGSGKTTLVEILSTTNEKTLGKIKYWFEYKSKSKIKHEIGMQFQEAIFPYDLTVKEILNLFMSISMWSVSKEELNELINIFKMENLLEQKGDILSGGERQKLNVLIALLKKPSILILDEISTGLDIESILDINNYIKKYLDETKSTLILISHNPGEAHRLTDKVIILKDGIISEEIDIKNKSEADVKKIFKDVYLDNIEELTVEELDDGINGALEE